MAKKNVTSIPRTKLLDTAISNIQNRVNQFKNFYTDTLYKEEYDVDYNIAGKQFVRKPSEDADFVFYVGTYKVDPRVDETGQAEFVVHYDNLNRKIKNIFVLTNDN